ncbi:MAG: hypothetical protein JWN38_1114 [Candidatus Saccharibacteria bacterium]|nr:hypothetical protein [Candidatus Saccharibacteria bacterium]
MVRAEHIELTTTDGLLLPGLLYTPVKDTTRVAIWLHGMGDSGVFYTPRRITALAEALTARGIALLAFNNRGAHNAKRLRYADKTAPQAELGYQGGSFYERIEDCVADIDGAVAYLRGGGYNRFYLVGHSSGANKIAIYDWLTKQTPISKYVLASPGDDIGLWRQELGSRRYEGALVQSSELMAVGKPLRVMPKYSGMHPYSAQSTHELLDANGPYNNFPYYEATVGRLGTKPLFQEFAAIKTPLLVIVGDQDQYLATVGGAAQAIQLLKQHTNPAIAQQSSYQVVANADHSFHDAEDAFAGVVAKWLAA